MRLVFNHKWGQYDLSNNLPLIYVECVPEGESPAELLQTGWLPWYDRWYQTRSSRLVIGRPSLRRRRELADLRISEGLTDAENREWIDRFDLTEWVEPYMSGGRNYTFVFDDAFWGLAKIYDDQLVFCTMSISRAPKSYGTLSYYYLMERFRNEFQYLYITDYYPEFEYKSDLTGFEYWTGSEWIKKQLVK